MDNPDESIQRHLTMVFGPKFRYFFFQLNEMRDEAETWWLVSGSDVTSSYFFKGSRQNYLYGVPR